MKTTTTTTIANNSQNESVATLEGAAKFNILFTALNIASTIAAFTLPFFFHSTSAIIAFVVFYIITGLGLTMGYHRLFAHHAYRVPKWMEHIIAICGYMAIQRGPIFWVAMHRLHHKHTDIVGKDPHTPKEGLWHVHFGWIQKRRSDIWDPEIYKRQALDLYKDPLYRWMDKESHDYLANFLLIGSAFFIGGMTGGAPGFDFYNAISWMVWLGLLNRVALLQAFGLINSVCHMWGSRPYKMESDPSSTNNFLVALIIFGEGWHNNHHTFPKSARHGLKWYQVDVAWYVIWLMQKIGLAKDVYLPSESQISDRKLKSNQLKNAQ